MLKQEVKGMIGLEIQAYSIMRVVQKIKIDNTMAS